MATKYIVITAGPPRDELLDALKYGYDTERAFDVVFTGHVNDTPQHFQFTAHITGIQHEDGSGHSFIVTAYATLGHPLRGAVTFYYDSRSRSGVINIP